LEEGEAIHPIFIAHNIGDSPCTVTEVRSGTLVLNKKKRLPSDLSSSHREKFDVKLESGERELFPANGGAVPTENDYFEIFGDVSDLYCIGRRHVLSLTAAELFADPLNTVASGGHFDFPALVYTGVSQ
jgi:hypothetical protein